MIEDRDVRTMKAPWNDDQVKSLNEYQGASAFHPFTCGKREPDNEPHILEATIDGWRCRKCEAKGDFSYKQDWCMAFMADWSWKPTASILGRIKDIFEDRLRD